MNNHTLNISNSLIEANFKLTSVAYNLLRFSMFKIHNGEFTLENEQIRVTLCVQDMLQFLPCHKSGSYYKELAKAATILTSTNIGYKYERKFLYLAIAPETSYDNGEFSILFNKRLTPVLQAERNYTKIDLLELFSINKVYAKRLYEFLMRYKYSANGGKYDITVDVKELMYILGYRELKKELNEGQPEGGPDYDAECPNFCWRDFQRDVLKSSIDLLKNLNIWDISFDSLRKGKGARIYAIVFHITLRNEVAEDKTKVEQAVREMMHEYVLSKSEIVAICQAGGYNMAKIKEKCELSKTQNPKNITAWMISALKNNYSRSKGKANRSQGSLKHSATNNFNNFKQRTYDFSELEKEAYANC